MIIIVILALFAFRSVFFVLPFGVIPGLSRTVSDMGHSAGSIFDGFGPLRAFAIVLLPVAFIILWGAVLIWVYRDAEKRGMSGILWLLLVLIGNVIGLVIYAIVRSETPIQAAGAGRGRGRSGVLPVRDLSRLLASRSVPCFEFCPYCGKSLKKICPACSKPVQDDWKVCAACGAGLDPGAIRQAQGILSMGISALNKSYETGGNLQATYQPGKSHLFVGGVEVIEDRANSSVFGVQNATRGAVYLQDEIEIGKPLTATLGLRYDFHSVYDDQWDPRLGILVRLPADYRLRASAGRSFRAPTFNDLYWPASAFTGKSKP